MLIATPISNLFQNNQDAMEIIKVSDCLECRDRSLNASFPKQYLMHLEPSIFHEWGAAEKAHLSETIRSKPDLKLVSFHLSSAYPRAEVVGRMFQPVGEKYSYKKLLKNTEVNIKWLRAEIGDEPGIAVENNNYYPTPAYDLVTEGRFISELMTMNKISFAFDIAHAMITAHNHRLDYQEYRDSLPLSSCIQLHVCGFNIHSDGVAYDDHDLPDKKMFEEVKILNSRYPVKYITVEYYKDKNELIKTLAQYRVLKKVLIDG